MRFALLLLPMALCLTGCYTEIHAPGAIGRVIDADTGKPLVGARVTRPFIPATTSLRPDAKPPVFNYPRQNDDGSDDKVAFIPNDIPAATATSDKLGRFDLPPASETHINFMVLRNPSETASSFFISADGYATNYIWGPASSKSLWRVELGTVRLKKQ